MASDTTREPDNGRVLPERSSSDTSELAVTKQPRADNGEALPESKALPEDSASPEPYAAASPSDDGADLIEMLEQLSETIDTAHHALDERLAVAAAAVEPHQPGPPSRPSMAARETSMGSKSLFAALSTCLLGLAALVAYWLLYSKPHATAAATKPKVQTHINETVVEKPPTVSRPIEAPAPEQLSRGAKPQAEDKLITGAANPAPPENREAAPPDRQPLQADAAPGVVTNASAERLAANTGGDPQPGRAAEQTTAMPEPPPVEPEPMSAAQESSILERGAGFVRIGDIASARLLFEFAAARRSAAAMYALARTYDRKALQQVGAIGITPDPDAAMKWYRQAAELGHSKARTKLAELSASGG